MASDLSSSLSTISNHFLKSALIALLIITCLINFRTLEANTSVSGIISSDTEWTVANSPYTVTGHVTVPSGITLTIDPGVTVKFDSDKVMEVEGTLVARGTSNSNVSFTSNSTSPEAGDWGYIKFSDSSTDASFDENGDYSSGSILENCVIEYAGGVGSSNEHGTGQVVTDSASPFINNCTVQHSSGNGIKAVPDGQMKITNSTISDTYSSGISCDLQSGSECYIHGNTITINPDLNSWGSYGVFANRDGNLTVSNNTISATLTYSESGIKLENSGTTVISGNEIAGFRRSGISSDHSYFSSTSITISNNTIHNNYRDGSGGGGIYLSGSSPTSITNNLIYNNSAGDNGGVNISAGSLTFENNIVSNNTAGRYAGGAKFYVNSSYSISNNTFSHNSSQRYGSIDLNPGGDSYGTFTNNTIAYNTTGPYDSTYNTILKSMQLSGNGLFSGNNVFGNNGHVYLNPVNDADSPDLVVENNWWDTTSTTELDVMMYDWNDYPTLGIIDYTPFLTSPSTSAPPSPPHNIAAQTGPTSVQLAWPQNPESDIAGYKVHYDTDKAGYPYATSIDVGNVTSFTLPDLNTETTYHIALSAYDSDGNESWVSTNTTTTTQSVPVSLSFTVQPGNGIAGDNLASQPVVEVKDLEGNTITSETFSITIAIATSSSNNDSHLAGTTTLSTIDGIASFTNLRIDTSGDNYALTASSTGVTSALSDTFTIVAGDANLAVLTSQPSDTFRDAIFRRNPVVEIRDSFGNIVRSYSSTIAAVITPGTGSQNGNLTGSHTVSAINGIATFPGLSIDTEGIGYSLTFSALGTPDITSDPFDILSNYVDTQVNSNSIQLIWMAHPESNISGYKVHYDTRNTTDPYETTVDVGNVTSYTLDNIQTGTDYHIAVSAYDSNNNESWPYSNTMVSTLGPKAIDASERAKENQTETFYVTGIHKDNIPLTFIVVAGPDNGTLSEFTSVMYSAASFLYTGNEGFIGDDSFTFQASDGIYTSSIATFTVTVVPLTAPMSSSSPNLIPESDLGIFDDDNITSDSTLTLSGSTDANAKVDIIANESETIATTIADSSGNWSVTTSAIMDGTHSLTASAYFYDSGDRTGSNALVVTIDTTGPVNASTPVLSPYSDSNVIADSTPTFAGTAEPGSLITLYANNVEIGNTTTSAGAYSVTSSTALDNNFYDFHVVASDLAGNESSNSPTLSLYIDNSAPILESISPLTLDEGESIELSVEFTDASPQPQNRNAKLDWGDGTTSNGIITFKEGSGTVTGWHYYRSAGYYTINLTITDEELMSDNKQVSVTVTAAPPQISFNIDAKTLYPGKTVIAGATITDGANETHTVHINWGDGTIESMNVSGKDVSGVTHTYESAGTYTATITVTDSNGVQATDSIVFTATAAGAIVAIPSVGTWGLIALTTLMLMIMIGRTVLKRRPN